ncbi:MAG: hypothetical protein ACKPCM_11370, partial [Pseudanabaena sp.]
GYQVEVAPYRAGVNALGGNSYVALQMMQSIGEGKIRVVPDVAVSGGDHGSGLLDGVLGMLLWNQTKEAKDPKIDNFPNLSSR